MLNYNKNVQVVHVQHCVKRSHLEGLVAAFVQVVQGSSSLHAVEWIGGGGVGGNNLNIGRD